ncbi:hypothetical protein JTE90_020526 [Oedothorax gibbosus]|uniref:Uncharacterized protein n=1 Tax=Oedothorax gibbosus TaxID=931172 RepID=A0AAV6VXQ2_9ARAC|nr:hypothetical protein JTE90_020526 [Oedothorax gibbosus]
MTHVISSHTLSDRMFKSLEPPTRHYTTISLKPHTKSICSKVIWPNERNQCSEFANQITKFVQRFQVQQSSVPNISWHMGNTLGATVLGTLLEAIKEALRFERTRKAVAVVL